MRLYASVIALCLAVLAVAGGLWLRARMPDGGEGPAAKRIEAVRDAFVRAGTPAVRFDLQALYERDGRLELVDPKAALPRLHLMDVDAARQLHTYAKSCDPKKLPLADVGKALTWARFVCNPGTTLPAGFFAEPPFMHPAGESFVSLALRLGRAPFLDDAWRRAHVGFLHVRELAHGERALEDPDPVRRLLTPLSRPALEALVATHAAVLTDGFVFFHVRRSGLAALGGEYLAFPRAVWDQWAAQLPYALVEREAGAACLYGSGTYCWEARVVDARARIYAGLALAALVLLTLTLALLAVTRIRAHRRDREHQTFILRMLTHELRTPATSLGLSLETLRDDFDQLPEGSQRAFLRICDELQRLGRVIAGSSRYLKMQGRSAGERFDVRTLESAQGFLDAVLEPYEGRVQVAPLAEDRAFRTDPYWLRVCLTNLVDNALQHGQPDVKVSFSWARAGLEVRVEDAGALTHTDLEALSRGAGRGEGQGGLGLGLGIVRRTVQDLGGSLRLLAQPTTFVMQWRESP